MIKLEKCRGMHEADKYSTCTSSGKERGMYELSFEDIHNNCSSIRLCSDCLVKLKTNNTVSYFGNKGGTFYGKITNGYAAGYIS